MKVSGDLAGEVGDRRGAGGGCRRCDPSGPGVSYTAMGRECHPAFCNWMEEAYGLHEASFLPYGLKDGEKAGEDLGGCKACGVRVNTAGRVNQRVTVQNVMLNK